jgi:prevent-host-death family protein
MTWALQDAKARLSELMRRAASEGPQFVTVRGKPGFVVLTQAAYGALQRRKRRRPLAELFRKSPVAGLGLDVVRSKDAGRPVDL